MVYLMSKVKTFPIFAMFIETNRLDIPDINKKMSFRGQVC